MNDDFNKHQLDNDGENFSNYGIGTEVFNNASESLSDEEETAKFFGDGSKIVAVNALLSEEEKNSYTPQPIPVLDSHENDDEDNSVESFGQTQSEEPHAQVEQSRDDETIVTEKVVENKTVEDESTSVDNSVDPVDMKNLINRVIRIVDVYRGFQDDERRITSQFLTFGKQINDEDLYVLSVLNVDNVLSESVQSLHEIRSLESVDKVFYILDLDDSVLRKIVDVLNTLDSPIEFTVDDKKKLVREIIVCADTLDQKSVEYLTATAKVLRANS